MPLNEVAGAWVYPREHSVGDSFFRLTMPMRIDPGTVRRRAAGRASWWLCLTVMVLPALGGAAEARADGSWNPIRALKRAPGRLVEAATAPAIQNAESSGHRLIQDLDDRLGRQVGNVDLVATGLVSRVDRVAADRIAQVDQSLEARILQVSTRADALVNGAVGGLDEVSRKRIAQAGATAEKLVVRVDKVVQDALERANQILRERQEQLGAMVTDAVRQADEVIGKRIVEVDDVVGRRIGNIDVTVTKQGAGVEQALLRLAVLTGVVLFVGFLLWRLSDDLSGLAPILAEHRGQRWAQTKLLLRGVGARLGVRLAAGGAAMLVLWVLYDRLPEGPGRRLEQVVADHRGALDQSFRRMEFTQVRYHASQLEILEPKEAANHRWVVRKAELMRDVLARPTLLGTPEGVAQLTASLAAADTAAGGPDPDLLVLKAFVLWQVGQLRSDEEAAAALCAEALQLSAREGRPAGQTALLAPLARHYLQSYLHQPRFAEAGAEVERLRGWQALAGGQDAGAAILAPIRHIVTYDRLVRRLDRESSAAYVDMIRAHAAYLAGQAALGREAEPLMAARDDRLSQRQRAVVQAKRQRSEAAGKVVEAWRQFDQHVSAAPELVGPTLVLAVFGLNDAILTRALWFADNPDARTHAPALTGAPPNGKAARLRAAEGVASRLRRAPPRLAWRNRYQGLLGVRMGALLDFQEAERFRDFERDVLAFEVAATELFAGTGNDRGANPRAPVVRRTAALAAARLGLYQDSADGRRVPLGRTLLPAAGEGERPGTLRRRRRSTRSPWPKTSAAYGCSDTSPTGDSRAEPPCLPRREASREVRNPLRVLHLDRPASAQAG